MTVHITKFKAALALIFVVLLVPATAIATHTFSDVEDGNYYTDAVEWAADNGITTGTSATTFSPDDDVTRAQNVTFAHRYDQNVVQPALTELESLLPIARSAGSNLDVDEDGSTTLLSVEIEAPVAGIIQLHGFVRVDTSPSSGVTSGTVFCSFSDGPGASQELMAKAEVWYSGVSTEEVTCPVSGALTVGAGTHTILLVAEGPNSSYFGDYQMNALFVPGGSYDSEMEELILFME
jgi:hypothetical protein